MSTATASVTVFEKGQEKTHQSSATKNATLFEYPDVVYYGIFFSDAMLKKLYEACPYYGRFAIANPHLTLAHRDGDAEFDGEFIEKFYEKSAALRVMGFCCDDDVVLALLDPETSPVSQSTPPHITLYRKRAVNLKEAADKCAQSPKKNVAVDLTLRGQVRAWSQPEE